MYRTSVTRESSHIYYNISIVNNTNKSIPAVFSETRTDSIVEDPSQYHLAVASFNIPTYIPIFQFQPNTYSVTLVYQGVPVQVFVSNQVSTNPSVPLLTNVTCYQQFIDQINLAFKQAYDTLNSMIVFPATNPCPSPPFIYFDNNTQIFSLVAHWAYNTLAVDTSLVNTIYIYMNSNLISFFPGMKTIFYGEGLANGLDTQLIISQDSNPLSWGVNLANPYFPRLNVIVPTSPYVPGNTVTTEPMTVDGFTNGGALPPNQQIACPTILELYPTYQPYFVNSQMFAQTSAWYDSRTLQLVTTLLPVSKEIIPGSYNNSRAILTDFNFSLYDNVASVIGYTQYTPSLYRLIELNSTESIKSADIYVYYTNNISNITQLMIPPQNELTLKLVFIRKTPLVNAS